SLICFLYISPITLHEDVLKAKEAPAPLKTEARAKVLKPRKQRAPPEETSLTTVPSSSSFPLTTKSAQKRENNNTLVFMVDVKVNRPQIKVCSQ
ncbi:hypothetical protein J0S82_012402, partial [Galemys pyrenaicus]